MRRLLDRHGRSARLTAATASPRMHASSERVISMPRLIIRGAGQERTIELVDTITIAGRSSENKIHIDDKQCSRQHCHFERTEHGVKLVDLESRNGTRVNDRVVNQALLRPGDKVDIGKHSLMFEDPNFKEPPPEIAARFAPAAAAPLPPAPAAGAPAPVSQGPAVPAAPSQAPAAPEGPRLRRRSGHTTASIQRTARFDMAREQSLLIKVGIAAGIFIFVLGVLIFLPSGGGDAALMRDQKRYSDARSLIGRGKLAEARSMLKGITHPNVAKQATALLSQLDADLNRLGKTGSREEEDAFSELYDYCEANRGNPQTATEVARRCGEFKARFPNSVHLPRINGYIEMARDMVTTQKKSAVADAERLAKEDAGRKEFGSAVKRLNDLLPKVTDIDARTHIVVVHDEIVDQAKKYFLAERAKADDHAARGRADDAKVIYQALIDSMGSNSVEELSDYCKFAQLKLKSLQ